MEDHREAPATADDIRQIVGHLDDFLIADILHTGATVREVAEAYGWLTADDATRKELHHPPHGVVAEVYEILAADLEEEDEEDGLEEDDFEDRDRE
jgi:hypothetical protein